MRYADVIVPLAVEGMYTYTVPVSLESEVREGTLVLVSFAGNKRYTALVGRIHDQAPVGYQVKPIEDVIEKQVSFSALHLRFLLWLGGYYMATPGEVMKAALPVAYHGGSGLCGVDYERKNLTPIFTAWRICFAERSGEISEN